jgi:6-phosphogluconolactonase
MNNSNKIARYWLYATLVPVTAIGETADRSIKLLPEMRPAQGKGLNSVLDICDYKNRDTDMHEWFVRDEFDAASKAAAEFIAEKIASSLQQRGLCHVVLPGGNTPAVCLGYLAEKKLQWDRVHWYLGDERCLPQGHAERNDLMLEKYFWSRLPHANAHPIPAELGAEIAAERYREVISAVDGFDIAVLGMGEDGHTASLFPHNKALNDRRSVVPIYDSPKPPAERVSLSVATLKTARCRIVLASGAGKADVIARIKKGEALPINSIGDIHWYVDAAAVTEKQ